MAKALCRATTKASLILLDILQKEANIPPERSGLGANGIVQAETGSIGLEIVQRQYDRLDRLELLHSGLIICRRSAMIF